MTRAEGSGGGGLHGQLTVTAAAGKQLVIKDRTQRRIGPIRSSGGEVLGNGIHLGHAALLAGENDVSATGTGGRVLGHVENRRFFIRGPSINFRKRARTYSSACVYGATRARHRVSLVAERRISEREKIFTDVNTAHSLAPRPRIAVCSTRPGIAFLCTNTHCFYPTGVFKNFPRAKL